MFLAKKKVNLSLTPREALQNIYGIGKFRITFLMRKLNYKRYCILKNSHALSVLAFLARSQNFLRIYR